MIYLIRGLSSLLRIIASNSITLLVNFIILFYFLQEWVSLCYFSNV